MGMPHKFHFYLAAKQSLKAHSHLEVIRQAQHQSKSDVTRSILSQQNQQCWICAVFSELHSMLDRAAIGLQEHWYDHHSCMMSSMKR